MKARLPEGRGGGGSIQSMMKQAQKMQEDMEVLRADLDQREYDIQAGGGAVKIKIDGTLNVKNIEIDPDIIDPDDPETLQDIIVAAVNEAIKTVNDTNNSEMEKVTGQMNLGGLGGLGL